MKTTTRIAACAAGFATVLSATAGFVHTMPKATNEKPLDTPYEELAETFKDPFGKVQTGCYWYWLRGNISSEGVRKDLEAMKKAGIDRAYIGDIGTGGCKPGPVKTFSPEWEDALQTAFATAERLGISLGLFNSPGWSQSGGPWVGPEQAMRRFVTSLTVVDGPAERVKLAAPKFEFAPAADMRDLFAVAYPAPEGFGKRLETMLKTVEDGKALVVELESPEEFAAQGAELRFESGKISGKVKVEAETDGAWKTICEMPFSRVKHGADVGFAPHSPVLASFAPVVARKFRVTVMPKGKDKAAFSSIALTAAPLVERAFEKSLGKMHETPLPMWHEYQWPVEDECAKGTALDPAKAVVLAGKVAPDGTLDWHVPEGAWAIYRFAAAPTGTKNGPANPEATGYEVDKMSREHIAMHFDAYLAKILDRTPKGPRRAIRHAVLDSYEMGGQNYTDGFAEKFRASFGYDPTPYLPALAGMAVSSRADSDRFLWDLRRFVADEVAYSYVGGLRDASNARGLGTWLECYGHWGFPGEFLQYGGQSDEIAGEFWSEGDLGNIENRAASSCAHTYGKRLVWSESNTCAFRPYGRSPADLKLRTDRFFAEGVNATLLHLYTHQPDDRKPGLNAWFGNEFNRNNTWFDKADVFTGYLKRCGHLLRQGLSVADIAYFIGEDAPKMTGLAEPAPPAGRQFDYINAEVLEETATVDAKGRIVLPHGTAYEVLVLPKLDTMRPKMIECIERLVNAGAFVFAPVKPKRSPSLSGQPQSDEKVKEIADRLWGEDECKGESVKCKVRKHGKGIIASGISLEEALKMRGSEPDVILHSTLYTLHSSLAYAHRTMPKAEIYFISNQSGEEIPSVEVSFRVSGRVPEHWDAVTGEIRVADKWREKDGRTAVTLSLAKHESAFVVFPAESSRGGAETRSNNNLCDSASLREINIPGPWTVSFESDALHRGPKEPIVLDNLIDLSTSDDPAIKFYSGNVVYRTKFAVPRSEFPVSRATLSFGNVAEIGRVKVNGREAGGVWTAPFAVPIAGLLKEGENTIEVEVATSWVNRLVGDAALPEEERPTWMATGNYKADSKLRPAGLVGPVRLVVERKWNGSLPTSQFASCAMGVAAKSNASERQVGLFYFLWLGEHGRKGPYDVTKILEADPDAGQKPDSPLWGPWGTYHHWGEPLYGYYFSDDEWVVRRHIKLIMQAGIDFLFFDTTNGPIYEKNAKLVMRVLQEYHDAGWKVPKVMFYTNSASGKTVQRIYDAVYGSGFAKEVWFELDGKPVIVAKEEECSQEMRDFFTIVKSQWPNEKSKKGGWPWMDFTRPQRVFEGEKVAKSVMNVSVAQHPQLRFGDSAMYGEKGNCGRAFHNGENDPAPGAWKKGYNFQEQWDRAHEAKPDIVLVTGWNEWIAGRWRRKDRMDRPVMFVDCANAEYSRDIEMMRGGYGDSYFLQLRDNVRRFKGLSDDDAANPPRTAKRYRCFADSAMLRDHVGYGTNYVNRTQRNAPEWIEVSHDAESVTFKVRTQKPIVGKDGEGDFMRILVNGKVINDLGEMKIDGNAMTLRVPRGALGLAAREFSFGFKFVDSTVPCRDPIDWYDHGVVEPLGRIEFRYKGKETTGL